MNVLNKNINNIFFIFTLSHLLIWTLVPSLTNNNLPLDTIEALAWGSNLDWGFNKHPPMSAFFSEVFFQVFGAQDWVYYFLSQIFVLIAFYYVFKFSYEIFKNIKLSLISVLLLESIYFYNFTTPEFNVNVCQLPFWSLVVYYSWKIYDSKSIEFIDCFLVGLFAAIGFLSKYLFIYLLISIDLLFVYLIFIKKTKKFDFKYLITLEVFFVLLVPHLIWLFNNDFITFYYGLERSGLESSGILEHIKYPVIFLLKQLIILIPFFVLVFLLVKKVKFKINYKDKKLLFLIFINILPIILMFMTSIIMGSKIRTMWMTPFYLFFGVLFIYIFQSQINLKKFNSFLYGFLLLFFLYPILYSYISISQTDKRTDYPGREVAKKTQLIWSQDFDRQIEFVTGDEWKAGNLSYHLQSRPKWEGLTNDKILDDSSQFICIDDVCLGRYYFMKIKILIPVYNDWQSLTKLINQINSLFLNEENETSIIVVNDASNHDRSNEVNNLENIHSFKILNMKINQGHTRCIAAGLKYIYEKEDFDYVIPMDGDGEDRPEEIKDLINQIKDSNGKPIIGMRIKRSESLLFQICYKLHKLITFTFTGKIIKFGNFTCLPKITVEKMINEKATWNSFSGALTKIENDLVSIPSIRGSRYFGPSKMNFYNLIKHSLSIISVFRKTFLIRSALFVVLYILLIKSNASIITAIPLVFLLIAVFLISNLALRENMEEFDKSLENISNIDTIK